MENPSTPKCVAADRRDNDRDLLRYDIGLDVEREHQQLREGPSARGSAQACRFLTKSPAVAISLTAAGCSS